MYIIQGKAHIFGDNIDTDQIYPGRYLDITSKQDIAKHCMEGARLNFFESIDSGDIIVAGKNFGCGSSREHAVITLVETGISGILAESFARIFYRNAINLGLPAIECKGISKNIKDGDLLKVNLKNGEIINLTMDERYYGNKLSDFVLDIFKNNGIKPLFKTRYGR